MVALGTPSELKRDSMKGELLLIECEPLGERGSAAIGAGCDGCRGLRQRSAPGGADAAPPCRALKSILRIAHHRQPHREDSPQPGRCFCFAHHGARCGGGAQAMSLTRLLAVARKEVVQILRDTRSLIIVVLMPVTLVLLFGYGVNLDLKGLPVYVYDQDGSQQSQDLLKHFQASEYFHVARVVDNYPADRARSTTATPRWAS
jgi:hypothetical protein